ncbi:unnamed protein product [Phytophthora lilii]|uniref:Unnamed protein product n=1 Tax=Phytophthora lilii TaxID=2077276 RepID=A0A9W7CVP0_9STRA|nr:unnamed protein product [Phytophthora lilii]
MLRRDKDIEAVFISNPHDSEKAERFKSQEWDALKDNPAYETLRKYADTVFHTELPNETPPKPVGWRIVHDYRLLNLATILPAIPMPRKEDTFNAMAGSYCGRPGTFNRLLQKVLRDLNDVMRIYFDDIYVYTKCEDVNKHIATLDRVLKRCDEQKLYIKLSKCQFCVDEILCLGDFVGRKGVRMDPDKVKIIAEWPIPNTKKQMESFLGTTVYVPRFCKDFAQLAGSLHECIKRKRSRDAIELDKNQPWFMWIPGETNIVADAMSRNPEFEHKAAQVSLKELLDSAQNREIVATMVENNMTVAQSAVKMSSWNKDLQGIVKKLKRGDKVPHYSLNKGVLYYQTREDETPRLYIPDDEDLKNRRTTMQSRQATQDITRPMSQQTKPPGLLQPLDIPQGISMDFVVSLPPSKDGYNAIMVIVDRLTKRAKFIATQTTDDAEDIAHVFMKSYAKDHGLPKPIVSDRDSKFTSKYLLGVVNPAQNDWDEFLHLAEFAYNRRLHATIGMSPFEADLGYIPYMPDDVSSYPEFKKLEKAAREFLLRQEVFLKVAQDRMSEAQERMKHYYDRNRLVQDFEIGDMCY